MRVSRFTEEQIIGIQKEREAGAILRLPVIQRRFGNPRDRFRFICSSFNRGRSLTQDGR